MPVDDLAGDFGNSLGKVFGATPQVQPRFEAGKLNYAMDVSKWPFHHG